MGWRWEGKGARMGEKREMSRENCSVSSASFTDGADQLCVLYCLSSFFPLLNSAYTVLK